MFILLIFREGPNTCELRSAKQSVFLFNCNKYPWLLREFLWCIGTTQGFLLLLIRALDIGVNYHRQDCSSHKVIAIVNTILLASRSFYSLIMPMKWSTIAMDSIIKILLAKICRKRTISIKLLHLVEFKPFCLFLINPPHTQTHTHTPSPSCFARHPFKIHYHYRYLCPEFQTEKVNVQRIFNKSKIVFCWPFPLFMGCQGDPTTWPQATQTGLTLGPSELAISTSPNRASVSWHITCAILLNVFKDQYTMKSRRLGDCSNAVEVDRKDVIEVPLLQLFCKKITHSLRMIKIRIITLSRKYFSDNFKDPDVYYSLSNSRKIKHKGLFQ